MIRDQMIKLLQIGDMLDTKCGAFSFKIIDINEHTIYLDVDEIPLIIKKSSLEFINGKLCFNKEFVEDMIHDIYNIMKTLKGYESDIVKEIKKRITK